MSPQEPAPGTEQHLEVQPSQSGWRLDVFLVHHYPQYSRVLIRKAISAGGVTIDGKGGKPAYRLKPEQRVTFVLPELPRESPIPEDIPLEILFEDEDLVVVNKPPDMVVHPARGHWSGTLVGALTHHFGGKLSKVRGPMRPGIVHRLDRDTSGAILVAKNDVIHAQLGRLFEEKRIRKEYLAIAQGNPDRDRDLIDEPIGMHPRQREKMAIRRKDPQAKPAQTFFEVQQRFRGFSLIHAMPRTGRTHQVRLHLMHAGCPVLCDRLYGGRSKITRGEISNRLEDDQVILARQALHAWKLTFPHPETEKELQIEAPLPEDMAEVLENLQCFRGGNC